ncbi:transferase family-domain-containing protein [Penicillium angulare]|uniref:transferase family-domain-containing protein n=1 Tax=Penicillium angulare TaxID=116970 RepID=UPI00253F7E40|nr:transferase family-domain-containing protein [Penicillium angulare]KAJ5261071.1 transferase family-domain-containing protein [Penicillium angulare]
MSSIPNFEPYVLSPLDHSTGLFYLSAFVTFEPEDVTGSVTLIERGFTRCIELLPFLAGNVASSAQLKDKENVFEVRPSTADFLQEYPMIKVKHHQKYVNSLNGSPVINNDLLLNDGFVSSSFTTALEELSPVSRVQINVMPDGIIICFSFHHFVMDGAGVANVFEALSICCRDLNATSGSLPTSLAEEQKSREIILNASSASSGLEKFQTGRGSNTWVGDMSLKSESPLTRIISFNAMKIEKLKIACTELLLKNKDQESRLHFSRNAIASAVIWLSFIRARHQFLMKNDEPSSTESGVLLACDIRNKLQPNLPLSYMGNAVAVTEAHISTGSITSTMKSPSPHSTQLTRFDSDDIPHITELATYIQESHKTVTADHVRDFISHVVNSQNWSQPPRFGDLVISSIRSLGFYRFDFGPMLGRMTRLDMAETQFSGVAWIMPARVQSQPAPWEIRLSLDAEMMGLLRDDQLVRWLTDEEGPKL